VEAVNVLVVELPYPPSVNHIWRRARGRTVMSREGRAFRREAVARLARIGVGPPRFPMRGRLRVRIEVCPPDHRRRDLDNVQKALLDALERGGAYADDGQIDRIEVQRGPVTPGGRVVVEVGLIP
jgi:crossover junction endodeoxyribonuclease RusA